ncbi:MAG: plasmid stabilization protein [Rhodoglobus sp.]|nr:plasmid stabilization protein [Rhodoglobus sp.]
MTYRIRFSARAERALSEHLPEKVAAAAFEFITGPLAENPHRVGKQLREPLYPLYSARRGEYRVVYEILEVEVVVQVVSVAHRREVYR